MILPQGFSSLNEYEFPNIINVCVLKGTCSASCVHCPVGKTPVKERKACFGSQHMTLSTFKKIVDEISNHSHASLRIHSVGEPTLWPHLKKALQYAKKKGVFTWIFSNAITSNDELLKTLARDCSIVEISVNSITSEDYKNTKGVDAYWLVIKNISTIHNIIQEENLKTRLILSRVQSRNKIDDENFVKFWKSKDISHDVFVRSFHDYNGIISSANEKDKNFQRILPCRVHWTRFNIDASGKAVVCFNELFRGPVLNPKVILGDIKTTSIKELWQGFKLSFIRKAQLEGTYNIMPFTENLPCKTCTFCQPLETKNTTSEYQVKKAMAEQCQCMINEDK